eukprot:530197-Heterocapsa_arctica.AAC.1
MEETRPHKISWLKGGRTARSGGPISTAGSGCRELRGRQQQEISRQTTSRNNSLTRESQNGSAPRAG